MNVVILARDGLFHKRFPNDLIPDLDCVLVNDLELGYLSVLENSDSTQLEFLMNSCVQVRSTISIHGQSKRCRDADLIQDLEDESSIPEDSLEVDLIHTERCP